MKKILFILILILFSNSIYSNIEVAPNPLYYNTLFEGKNIKDIILDINQDYINFTQNFTINKGSAFYIPASNGREYFFGDEQFFINNGYENESGSIIFGSNRGNQILLNLETMNQRVINDNSLTPEQVNLAIQSTFIHEVTHLITIGNSFNFNLFNQYYKIQYNNLNQNVTNQDYYLSLVSNSSFYPNLDFMELSLFNFNPVFIFYNSSDFVYEIQSRLTSLCFKFRESNKDLDYRDIIIYKNYSLCEIEYNSINPELTNQIKTRLNQEISFLIEGYIDNYKYIEEQQITYFLTDVGGGLSYFLNRISLEVLYFILSLSFVTAIILIVVKIKNIIKKS